LQQQVQPRYEVLVAPLQEESYRERKMMMMILLGPPYQEAEACEEEGAAYQPYEAASVEEEVYEGACHRSEAAAFGEAHQMVA
jgi:hypothetical protein